MDTLKRAAHATLEALKILAVFAAWGLIAWGMSAKSEIFGLAIMFGGLMATLAFFEKWDRR